jgi:hypothetical protein
MHVATAEAFLPATPDLVLTDLALSAYCWHCRGTLQNANDFERHLDDAAVTATVGYVCIYTRKQKYINTTRNWK